MGLSLHPAAEIFPRMSEDEFAALKEDIRRQGLLEAVWLYRGFLLDGRHRYRACQELGIDPTCREYVGDDPVGFVISMNLNRRHLDTSQRAMVAARLANMRQGERTDLPPNGGMSQPHAAEVLNVGTRSVQRAQRVLEVAEMEVIEAVTEGILPVSQAVILIGTAPVFQRAVVRRIEQDHVRPQEAIRLVRAEATSAEHIEHPTGEFRVLYADPPWSYGNTMPDEFREQRDHYPVMSMDDLCALPVKDMAEDDAVLFLWATNPILEAAFVLISAWGFKYKALFVWDKQKHVMGHYNSVRNELLLVCVRGSCQPDVRKLFDSVVSEERTEHSRKPAVFYEIIETLYPHGKRLELFARNRREGWDSHGYETDKFTPR